MGLLKIQSEVGEISKDQIRDIVEKTVSVLQAVKNVLVIHADYSRHDYTEVVVPELYAALESKGLKRLDTLNAGGTHRAMTIEELESKLGISKKTHPLVGQMLNHEFDNPDHLMHAVDLPSEFVSEKTSGHLSVPLAVTVNKLVTADYDLVVAISGTVPHEAIGYSGGTKIFFPGISGPEVIGLLHWAAVLIGIPQIIGTLANPAREVVDEGSKYIFDLMKNKSVLSLNMVYTEDEKHQVVPKGLFTAYGYEGFRAAHREAADLSSKLHIVYLDEGKDVVVQQLPKMYDEIWTAGKGSYKLQRQGVLNPGAEIILYAPHIHCFHSNKTMDEEIRAIGYHGRDFVLNYCKANPKFNKNVASHVINVRGFGSMINGVEEFPFKVTLATQISEADCAAANLGYRNPESLRAEDFQSSGKLWIHDGGQWLYSLFQ